MTKNFQNVKMVCREDSADHLLVEQGDGLPDKLFFCCDGDNNNAYLNATQVGELVRRMNAWLEGLNNDKLWEDA